jgi:hypothetical protein
LSVAEIKSVVETNKEGIKLKTRGRRQGSMKEGMIVEELVILEVIAELMDTTHLLTQKEIFMHRMILVSSPEVSLVRHQRRKQEVDSLQGELRKLKPPSFEGEREREDDVEAWLLGLKRYFQLHNYSSNLEARIATYHLHRKAAMWWDQLKQVEHVNESRITWKKFKKYFQKEYLSDHFYDKKMQEFFELSWEA